MVGTHEFLILSAALFAIGVAGVVSRRNLFIIFMSIELMLNAVNLSFITFSRHLGTMDGHMYTFLVIALAAAEAAIGLAVVILLFKNKESLSIDDFRSLKQ
jgi:NADH-quinone oxidoreductase subunit K